MLRVMIGLLATNDTSAHCNSALRFGVIELRELDAVDTDSWKASAALIPLNFVIVDFGSPLAGAVCSILSRANAGRVTVMHPGEDVARAFAGAPRDLFDSAHVILCLPPASTKDLICSTELMVVKRLTEIAGILQRRFRAARPGGVLSFTIAGCAVAGRPVYAGLAGFISALGREWSRVRCKLLLVESAVPLAADLSIAEALDLSGEYSVIYRASRRFAPRAAMNADLTIEKQTINENDLILATGGGRGITAECCVKLGEETGCSFILLGRTSPDATAGNEKSEEIRATIERLGRAGCRVEYLACDIRNRSELAAAMGRAVHPLREITGVIHGAGVIADRLIARTTGEDFDNVVGTKAIGLANLLQEGIITSRTRFLALFSSVAGLLGNSGQTCYSLANGILNAAAFELSAQLPQARVTSILWGAWDMGVVDGSLKRKFIERGIDLLERGPAAEAFLKALRIRACELVVDTPANLEKRIAERRFSQCGSRPRSRAVSKSNYPERETAL